ncbi:MAG: ABC transporter permease, partial [bacterium]
MFQNRLEGLVLALPAVLFTATLFLLPVLVLLSEGFRVDDAWSL